MEVLQKEDINKYTIIGLKEICRFNRQCLSSYNLLKWDALYDVVSDKLDEGNIIKVPSFILNNERCMRKTNIKLYYKYIINGKKGFETERILQE